MRDTTDRCRIHSRSKKNASAFEVESQNKKLVLTNDKVKNGRVTKVKVEVSEQVKQMKKLLNSCLCVMRQTFDKEGLFLIVKIE